MDVGYMPWSGKGKSKDGKDKGHKGGKAKVTRTTGTITTKRELRGTKESPDSKDKGGNAKGQGKQQGRGKAETFPGAANIDLTRELSETGERCRRTAADRGRGSSPYGD
eukprot:3455984-Amphidinium_carterae.2